MRLWNKREEKRYETETRKSGKDSFVMVRGVV